MIRLTWDEDALAVRRLVDQVVVDLLGRDPPEPWATWARRWAHGIDRLPASAERAADLDDDVAGLRTAASIAAACLSRSVTHPFWSCERASELERARRFAEFAARRKHL